ncbi:MAG: hypothetical protein ACK55X_05490 [Synechococcaceae cyanobacterium]|jgi:hypothetical protein
MGAELLLALGLPLLLLTGLTLWLANRRHRLPAWLAWLEARSGTIWVSGVVLMTSILLVRQLLQRAR